jgi:hypothetical protein
MQNQPLIPTFYIRVETDSRLRTNPEQSKLQKYTEEMYQTRGHVSAE